MPKYIYIYIYKEKENTECHYLPAYIQQAVCVVCPTSKTCAQSKICVSKGLQPQQSFTKRNQCTNTQCAKLNQIAPFMVS